MVDTQAAVAIAAQPARSANTLCFLLDADFVFRQDFAKELRRRDIDVVEFSDSTRILDMVSDQNPDIVFINLSETAPHESVRAMLALKECRYAGAVQLFGNAEPKMMEGFRTIGTDCSLTMLPPLTKPIKLATVHQIILERKLGTPASVSSGLLLSEALTQNLVQFLYQPKLDLRRNVIVGVEAVARVAHPKLGPLTPDQFLKGADADALLKLSRLALVNALKASASFHKLGVALQLAINIGVDNLLRLPIADLVKMHRPEHENWPGIILEIPERQVTSRIDALKPRAANLHQSGAFIAIDNFGCGSSSLGILNQIPFAEIKIDRSLVDGCTANQGNANICKTIVQMSHNFGSRSVAVGISTEADLRTLASFYCDAAQGFLIGKPMKLQQVEMLISNFRTAATA
jgi:EAL domain-containing protein (putative c-di-GMP-specific phosphodiesterase class I)